MFDNDPDVSNRYEISVEMAPPHFLNKNESRSYEQNSVKNYSNISNLKDANYKHKKGLLDLNSLPLVT